MKIKLANHIAFAAVFAASAFFAGAQTPDRTINTFDTGTQAVQPDGCGFWYGTGTAGWDAAEDATGNGGGSLYIQTTWGGGDTPLTEYVCLPGNNLWWQGAGTYNLSEYKSIQFDLKWDTNSDVTIAQWNDPSTFPNGSLGGSIPGLEIDAAAGDGSVTAVVTTNIPAAAASGWVHMTIPINPTQSGIDPSVGIMFKKWLNNNSSITGTHTANFWVDNVILEGTAGPPPPPTVKPLARAVQGLNVFASTQGNSYYDRQEIMSRQTSGLSWIGNATAGNPVTYSFTVTNFPTDPATYGCIAYLFFSPNAGWNPSAPDWNNTNCAMAVLQFGGDGATLRFQYKVNEDNQNAMYGGGTEPRGAYTNAPGSWDGVTANYLESGNLGAVTCPTLLGTWSIKFTSDTNITLIAPDNTSTNLVIPPYNAGKLAPTDAGFNLYLGFQANNQASLNRAAVFSSFAVEGAPSAFNEDFMAESALDTVSTWDTSVSSGPNGVRIVPAGSAYWLNWSLPDTGFAAEAAGTLTNSAGWTPLAGPVVGLVNQRAQLVASSELPAGNSAFFRLIKRAFTKLQVLLPGESPAPNTPTGKTGTPDPVSLGAGGLVNVTIRAVDDNWNLISTVRDVVHVTTDDLSAVTPLDGALVGGTNSFYVQFGAEGNWTITVSDVSDGTKTPGTSAPVTVGP
ncbi:MAG TPA: hypothetical protein VFV96_11125 [Verrucomicrobiae bacterium]|nr:hypothetical protein [Verrucomicrobiae bacterium]